MIFIYLCTESMLVYHTETFTKMSEYFDFHVLKSMQKKIINTTDCFQDDAIIVLYLCVVSCSCAHINTEVAVAQAFY